MDDVSVVEPILSLPYTAVLEALRVEKNGEPVVPERKIVNSSPPEELVKWNRACLVF